MSDSLVALRCVRHCGQSASRPPARRHSSRSARRKKSLHPGPVLMRGDRAFSGELPQRVAMDAQIYRRTPGVEPLSKSSWSTGAA